MREAGKRAWLWALAGAIAAAPLLAAVVVAQTAAPAPGPNTVVQSKVDWPAATQAMMVSRRSPDLQKAATILPRDQLDIIALPVLLPKVPGPVVIGHVTLLGYPDTYHMILSQGNGISLHVSGTRSFHPENPGRLKELGFTTIPGVSEPVLFQSSEAGQTVNVSRYGVSYTIDVQCSDPNAPQCADQDYLMQVLPQMTEVVLGAAAQKEAGIAAAPADPQKPVVFNRDVLKRAAVLRQTAKSAASSSFVGKP